MVNIIKEKTCKDCNKTLDIINFTKSKNIKDGYENKCKKCRAESRKKYINKCKVCSMEFKTARKQTKYCSRVCQGKARRNRVLKNCSYCNQKIEVIKSKSKKHEDFYCNQDCRTKHLKITMKGNNNPNYKEHDGYIECTNCHVVLSVENFYKTKSNYASWCKECTYKIAKSRYNHNCEYCNKKFTSDKKYAKYCSNKCSTNSQKNRVTLICEICNKSITRRKSNFDRRRFIYCSHECKNIGYSKYFSGQNSVHYNPKLTEEHRIKGRNYEAYRIWRKEVYERDNYACQCCGSNKSGTLVAHHILNYSEHEELRTDIDNGITLCKNCHRDFHNTYGYKNNNLEQLNEFIDNTQQSVIFYAN